MISKKSRIMALCEELATPVTQDGEFLLKGGFGNGDGGTVVVVLPAINAPCTNENCKNSSCYNGGCNNPGCENKNCENGTIAAEVSTITPGSSTKASDAIVQCGFLF